MLGANNYVFIVLTDNTSLQCSALAPTRFGGTKVIVRIADELQATIDEYRDLHTGDPGRWHRDSAHLVQALSG